LLCYLFINRGLHRKDIPTEKRKLSLLDLLQKTYDKSIEWCLKHSRITIAGSLSTIVLAGFLFKVGIKQKFFPEAERNQFTVELWMPSGTKLEKTEKAILRIENVIKDDERIRSYATFIGRSAPRFYYNYSPEMPAGNFAQILINTQNKQAEPLYKELSEKVRYLVPEGSPYVKLMQQGQPMSAHVEVRISGYDIDRLKKIGEEVGGIIRKSAGSDRLRSDFRDDSYGVRLYNNKYLPDSFFGIYRLSCFNIVRRR
jgi:multidrug efflux pump subunit AcrB